MAVFRARTLWRLHGEQLIVLKSTHLPYNCHCLQVDSQRTFKLWRAPYLSERTQIGL
jgi:hypothetical protein